MPQPLNIRFVAPLLLVAALGSTAAAQGSPFKTTSYGVSATGSLLGNLRNADGSGDRVAGVSAPYGTEAYGSITGIGGSGENVFSGHAKARASMAQGTIGAETSAFAGGPDGTGALTSSVTALAQMWDTVTITAGEGLNFGKIPLQLELDGTTTGNTNGVLRSRASGHLRVWDYTENREVVSYSTGDKDGSFVLNTTLGSSDSLVAPLTSRKYQIWFSIQTYSSLGSSATVPATSADFLNTLHFRWSLPQGTTATSDSGVFMPASIQAVPEPATLGVLAVGAVALLRRRRR